MEVGGRRTGICGLVKGRSGFTLNERSVSGVEKDTATSEQRTLNRCWERIYLGTPWSMLSSQNCANLQNGVYVSVQLRISMGIVRHEAQRAEPMSHELRLWANGWDIPIIILSFCLKFALSQSSFVFSSLCLNFFFWPQSFSQHHLVTNSFCLISTFFSL